MLQSAKNLVKFVQTINPNGDAVIRLGIGYDLEVNGLFFFHKGNGKEMFAKLMRKGLFNLEADENYYRLDGTLDGYRVKVTFDIKQKDDKAGYPELAKCSTHWNYMTPEEWERFIENAGGHDEAKRKMEFNENNSRNFSNLISGGFAWDESKEGSKYWLNIYYRTEPIV